jgi:hypothetical protein
MPLSSLPADFQSCLPPNKPSAACDTIIGNSQAGLGYCGNPEYREMTYCACVNNAVACPNFSMASCANSEYSYKPWSWDQPGTTGGASKNELCAKAPICVNLVEVGGSQNVVSGITQQCGVIQNVTNIVKENPTMAILLFILIIALIIVSTMHVDPDPSDVGGRVASSYDN